MESSKGALLVVLAAAAILMLSAAGGADAEEHWSREQVLKMYIDGPSTIVAGPGSATNNMSQAAFGTFAVYDVAARAENDDTSEYYGQCRGWFLMDSKAGTNIMTFFTLDFESRLFNGSVIVSGTQDLTAPRNTVAIIGGSGYFSDAKGYVHLTPVLPDSKGTSEEELVAIYFTEVHYMLPELLSESSQLNSRDHIIVF